MTTDEMILALVERHGFKLPPNIQHDTNDFWCRIVTKSGHDWAVFNANEHHDLCAMEFARQASAQVPVVGVSGTFVHKHPVAVRGRMWRWLEDGDSAAAIKALYEAMETK